MRNVVAEGKGYRRGGRVKRERRERKSYGESVHKRGDNGR